jgi:lipopolysaccharide export LptBFGC system permease protein LptF
MMRIGLLTLGLTMSMAVWADVNKPQHLNNSGQTKVNTVQAKNYLNKDGSGNGYNNNGNTIVNVGSRRQGTCNLNVGASDPNNKNSKEVVVNAKNIINVCK